MAAVLDPSDDGLATSLKGGDGLANLGLLRDAGGERAVHQDADDISVFGGEVDCLQRPE